MARTVLHIITDLDGGGAEHMLTRVALTNAAHNPSRQIVVSLMDEGVYAEPLRDAGVEVHYLHMRRGPSSILKIPHLAALIRRHRPEVIMTWLYHADLVGTLGALLAGMGTRRIVWNLRCSNIDFSQYHPLTRWVVRTLAWLSPLPAAIAANSQAGIDHHRGLGFRPKQWVYLPNGFDLDEWRPDAADRAVVRTEWGLADDAIAIGIVARVNPQKDHATFLAAAERLCDRHDRLRFVLIGRGTEFLKVPAPLAGRTVILGERREVQRLMRGLDVAVLSSSFGEGFPNIVGEAMATGVPCVVTEVGDSAAVVGATGLVVPPRSPEALADAVARLIAEPGEMRKRRAAAARAFIRDNYDLARIVARYNEVLAFDDPICAGDPAQSLDRGRVVRRVL